MPGTPWANTSYSPTFWGAGGGQKGNDMSLLAAGALGVGQGLTNMFGADQRDPIGKLHVAYADPFQGLLTQGLIKDFMAGRGDFGFGQATKQGMSQLQQLMADRGVRPDSGVFNAGLSNMLAQASMQDAMNRRQYGMGLASMAPQMMTSGHGWDDRPRDLSAYNSALAEMAPAGLTAWDPRRRNRSDGYGPGNIGGG
jgi:hypothetical protein